MIVPLLLRKASSSLLTALFLVPCAFFKVGNECEFVGTSNIQKENGIVIARNPNDPLYGVRTFHMNEDKNFDPRPDDHPGYFRINSIEIDFSGNLYVLDGYASRIYKFDRRGRLIQAISLKGDKKGEFENLLQLGLGRDGRLYVLEPHKIHVFSQNGRFEKSIDFECSLFYFGLMDEGKIMANLINSDRSREIALFDGKGAKIRTVFLAPPKQAMPQSLVASVGALSHIHVPRLHLSAIDEKTAVYGHSSEYRLHLINNHGDELRIIEKEESPEPLSRAEKQSLIQSNLASLRRRGLKATEEDAIRALPLEEYKPFYHFIFSDDKSFIFTVRLEKQRQTTDVFDRQGRYLERIQSPIFPIFRIFDGFLYSLRPAERKKGSIDVVRIVRYKFRPSSSPSS
jgi:hypothetical protein